MKPHILELLTSRVCHDLISPIGAIQNGVEFLEDIEMSDDLEDGFQLISHSVKTAATRLKVFRLVYGLGGRDNGVSKEDIYNTFQDYLNIESKIIQDWDPHAAIAIESEMNGFPKILLGTLMLAHDCLPRGGTISSESSDNSLFIHATGQNATVREQVSDALNQTIEIEKLDPRLVHPYIISVIAKDLGFSVSISDTSPNQVTFKIGTE